MRPEEKLRAILEIVTELTGDLELGSVLEKVLGALLRIFPRAERAFVLFKDAGGQDIRTGAIKVRHPGSSHPAVSRTIYEYVTGEGRAILCEDVAADGRFQASRSVRESQARTMMCVPLWDHGRRAVGVLQIDTRAGRSRFGRDDLDLLVAVAGAVGMAVEGARLHEVALRHEQAEQEGRDARAVQRALLPDRTPDLPGYEFWHDYEPARCVGGDYFDYRPLPGHGLPSDDRHGPGAGAIALGDVSGKGMPAALLMARISSEVRLLLQAEPDPARVVELLNRNLCDGGTAEKFVTFLLLVLDGDRHELTVVNAGHMGPMIRRSDGRIEVVSEDHSGPVLGVIEGQSYRAGTTTLGTGDVVVAYTDGVTDATSADGSQFGIERLRADPLRRRPEVPARSGRRSGRPSAATPPDTTRSTTSPSSPSGGHDRRDPSAHFPPAIARSSRLRVIRCTRASGPCGRVQWDQGSVWPGGELSPCDQKIVEALKTKFPFGPG